MHFNEPNKKSAFSFSYPNSLLHSITVLNPIKIGLAESQDLMRCLLSGYLANVPNFEVLFDVNNGQDLLQKTKEYEPDIVIFDTDLPIVDGWEVLWRLHKERPKVKKLILTNRFDDYAILDVFANKANGILSKMTDINTLIEAVSSLKYENSYLKNHGALREQHLRGTLKVKSPIVLTSTEHTVLRLCMYDLTKHEICKKLGMKVRTVEWHKGNIISKTNCCSIDLLRCWSFEELARLFQFTEKPIC